LAKRVRNKGKLPLEDYLPLALVTWYGPSLKVWTSSGGRYLEEQRHISLLYPLPGLLLDRAKLT